MSLTGAKYGGGMLSVMMQNQDFIEEYKSGRKSGADKNVKGQNYPILFKKKDKNKKKSSNINVGVP